MIDYKFPPAARSPRQRSRVADAEATNGRRPVSATAMPAAAQTDVAGRARAGSPADIHKRSRYRPDSRLIHLAARAKQPRNRPSAPSRRKGTLTGNERSGRTLRGAESGPDCSDVSAPARYLSRPARLITPAASKPPGGDRAPMKVARDGP